jgi:hypothetical protein
LTKRLVRPALRAILEAIEGVAAVLAIEAELKEK